MGIWDVVKNLAAAAAVDFRLKRFDERIEKIEECLIRLSKDSDMFSQKDRDLNSLHIKKAREVQHRLIREVYDFMDGKMEELDDDEVRESFAKQIRTQAIERYWHKMERTHLENDTDPKMIELIMDAMKPAIMYIVDKYDEEFLKMFTSIRNGTRRVALKRANDLYCKELCIRFDDELYKYIEIAKKY
jgi:hypothetical protein